ncbi:thiol reductant ABC exporter subunit CydC [Chloroflexota bacterium]
MRGTTSRLLKLAAPFTRGMALAALLGFATIGSSVGLMATAAYLISKAAVGYRLWPVSAQPSIADLQVAIVGVRFFGIARGVFRYLERYVSHDVTFHLLARLRVWFYQALEPLAPARLMQYRSGDLLARIVADIETLENFYLRVLAPPIVALLVTLLATVLMGLFDPRLGIVLLVFLLLAGVGVPLWTRTLSRHTGRHMVRVRAGLNSVLVDGIQGVADLLAFGQGARHLERVRRLSGQLEDLQQRMAKIGGLHSALTGLLMNLATLAVLVVSIPLVGAAELDGVFLAVLIMVVISSFEAVWPLPQAFQYLETSLEAARRLYEIVDTEPAVTDPPSPLPAPGGSLDFVSFEFPQDRQDRSFDRVHPEPRRGAQDKHELRVENLRFSYNPGEPPALDGVSFVLPQGARVAVVGSSGAGKSTLGHLLLRFWEYQEGHILLGGQELRDYGQEDVRRLIAVVSQRTHLFNATVRENLLLAWPEASDEEMLQAAQRAQIHDFIQSLPQGYDTWIGEQGLQLSGGERQRLAIARAILKNAPILILDEPTANLDTLTERQILGTFQTLMAGCTALIMTHRLVGLEALDEILVLQAGRIVERGRHHDLMQMGGVYRRMWELQNQMLVDTVAPLL